MDETNRYEYEGRNMVKFLVDKGHTVFMISWKNPTSEDRDLSLVDYVKFGVMDALDAINQIIPQTKIHAVGYCIGGTLLMIAAARMAKKSDDRLKSITLFAAEIDFRDASEDKVSPPSLGNPQKNLKVLCDAPGTYVLQK